MRRSYFAGVFGVHGFKGPRGADLVTNFNFSSHSFYEFLVLWVVQDNVVLVRVGEGLEGSQVDDTFDFEDLNVKGNAGKGGGGGGGGGEGGEGGGGGHAMSCSSESSRQDDRVST